MLQKFYNVDCGHAIIYLIGYRSDKMAEVGWQAEQTIIKVLEVISALVHSQSLTSQNFLCFLNIGHCLRNPHLKQ